MDSEGERHSLDATIELRRERALLRKNRYGEIQMMVMSRAMMMMYDV